jgi:hypothetical protein
VSAEATVIKLFALDLYRFKRLATGARGLEPRSMPPFCTGIKPGLAVQPLASVRAVMRSR